MDQLELAGPSDNADRKNTGRASKKAPKKATPKPAVEIAAQLPVARISVDVSAAAVDRLFEYVIPEKLSAPAQPGVRVRVRFAGRLVDGFLIERVATAVHTGRLAPIERVLGPPVLTDAMLGLAQTVAAHYAGTLADVLRDAVPPRHAAAERAAASARPGPGSAAGPPTQAGADVWNGYAGGSAMIARLHAGEQIRAAVSVAPTHDPTALVADLVASVDGRAVIVVPDARDLQRFAVALQARFPDRVARLSAATSPEVRYRSFLDILAGTRDIVVATRNGVFAPVPDARLLIVWDDGDEALCEPRSPGWHAREVLALRSHGSTSSWLAMSHSRSVEVARLVVTGWARAIDPDRATRHRAARVLTTEDGPGNQPDAPGARIPTIAWRTIRAACHEGPVLVQVARSGYQPAMACADCRTPAQCTICTGPLATVVTGDPMQCRWCGATRHDWECAQCGSQRLRSMAVGSARTAEELSRAFPGVDVVVSGRATEVLNSVGSQPGIVVATVGAEPVAKDGYRAAVLLDGSALLARTDLRSEEETLRRWFNVLALVRGADAGGQVVVTADPSRRAVQALIRVDPQGWANREFAERQETRLPPAWRAASVTGHAPDVTAFADRLHVDPDWRVLGPVPVHRPGLPSVSRLLVLVPAGLGSRLADSVKAALLSTPDRGSEHRVQVRLDPLSLF